MTSKDCAFEADKFLLIEADELVGFVVDGTVSWLLFIFIVLNFLLTEAKQREILREMLEVFFDELEDGPSEVR